MAVECPRRGIDAIGPAAEINLVEVEFEDLLLCEFALEGQCHDHFVDLASEVVASIEK